MKKTHTRTDTSTPQGKKGETLGKKIRVPNLYNMFFFVKV